MLSIFMKKLTVNEAKNKVTTSDNAVLIDCRPKEDYAHGHVAGAIFQSKKSRKNVSAAGFRTKQPDCILSEVITTNQTLP